MTDSSNMELEPPKVSDVKKIAELDDDIESHDHILDIITEIVKQKLANLEVQNKNRASEIEQEQDRLSKTFSHNGSGSRDSEGLSDNDDIDQIQEDLKTRIFDN